MGITVNLDRNLVESAKNYAAVQSRSVTKQIEHWAKIGRIAEENPDLTYDFIMGLLQGVEELPQGLPQRLPQAMPHGMKTGNVEKYRPDDL